MGAQVKALQAQVASLEADLASSVAARNEEAAHRLQQAQGASDKVCVHPACKLVWCWLLESSRAACAIADAYLAVCVLALLLCGIMACSTACGHSHQVSAPKLQLYQNAHHYPTELAAHSSYVVCLLAAAQITADHVCVSAAC